MCPGNIDNAVSSSGHPKNTEGIKSVNVCVIDIETMKTARYIGLIFMKIEVEREISKTPRRFIWIPGVNPVTIPARMPINKARIISNNIL